MTTVILIPTYNERENILLLIPRLFTAAPDVFVLVIDDNSPDGTAKAVKELCQKFPNLSLYQRERKEGLGKAYLDAFRKVLSDSNVAVVCTMDADLSHAPEALPAMLRALSEADMIIGSRYVTGGSVEGWEPWRKFLSGWGNRYSRLVTRLPVRDCTSGFSCISADALRRIDFSDFDMSGYAFLIYLKYKLWRSGMRLFEVPIHFKNRLTGESKISLRIVEEGLLLPWRLIHKPFVEKIKCPTCGSIKTKFWFIKNACTVNRCQSCGLIFIHPLPPSFNAVYAKDYFCGALRGHGYVNYDLEKKADNSTFTKYLTVIETYTKRKGKLLDVGAATGAFVACAIKRGWQAEGIEISDFAAAAARANGMPVATGTLETVAFPAGSFDVITLLDVFEHVPDPTKTLKILHEALKINGLLVINTPNASSFWARLTGRFWPLIIPPEHIRLFNATNLISELRCQGFKTETITTIGKRFTLPYIFRLASTIRGLGWLKQLAQLCNTPFFNHFSIPLNLHDNIFVIARKN